MTMMISDIFFARAQCVKRQSITDRAIPIPFILQEKIEFLGGPLADQ
jgi:hypothetical protein